MSPSTTASRSGTVRALSSSITDRLSTAASTGRERDVRPYPSTSRGPAGAPLSSAQIRRQPMRPVARLRVSVCPATDRDRQALGQPAGRPPTLAHEEDWTRRHMDEVQCVLRHDDPAFGTGNLDEDLVRQVVGSMSLGANASWPIA